MALLFECMGKCCRNMLDTADIVRDACSRQLSSTVGLLGRGAAMTREKKTGWRRSVLRIGAAMQAILYAVLVTGIVWR